MSTRYSLLPYTQHFSIRIHRNLCLRQIQSPSLRRERILQRCLATVNRNVRPDVGLTTSGPCAPPEPATKTLKPDERTVKLGKTLRTLQERLPTLLQKPLPQEILSPQITLHLFPSTHPHLPTVTGRVAYSAALWTSPIAWGRLPLISNVRLEILSERMIKQHHGALGSYGQTEQLVVRWSTIGKTRGKGTGGFYQGISASENVDKITEWLGGGDGEDDGKEFTGLFIFEFDQEGRIATHIIEHAQEGGNWEDGVGAKVVALTDWLLGRMKGNRSSGQGAPCPAYSHSDCEKARDRMMK